MPTPDPNDDILDVVVTVDDGDIRELPVDRQLLAGAIEVFAGAHPHQRQGRVARGAACRQGAQRR